MRIGAGLGAHPCCGFAGGGLPTMLCLTSLFYSLLCFSMLCWWGVTTHHWGALGVDRAFYGAPPEAFGFVSEGGAVKTLVQMISSRDLNLSLVNVCLKHFCCRYNWSVS